MYDDNGLKVFQFDLELLHIPLRVYDFSCILHFHITLLTQIIFFTHHTTPLRTLVAPHHLSESGTNKKTR